jgi:hypothetical protein
MIPPAVAVGALYDSLLQSALRQFFERATLDAEPTPSLSSDGRLAIEPSPDPFALTIRWFGTRYTLRVERWPFTPHEVRLARAIGAVLAARYRAILNPRIVAERGDLFRGAIEDRYIGAFLDDRAYAVDARETRADRIASMIELLRVAALSSYENRPISTGVLLLGTADDPCRPARHAGSNAPSYAETLTSLKSLSVATRASTRRARRRSRRMRAPPSGSGTCVPCSARRTRSRCLPRAPRSSRSVERPGICWT